MAKKAKRAKRSTSKIAKGHCKVVGIRGSKRCMCKLKNGRVKFSKKGKCRA